MTLISVVSPVYQAEELVPLLVSQISREVQTLTSAYEIILVDDRSRDGSWQAIRQECQKNARIKGLRLSRNFGQHCAITAGLRHAKGDWIVVMDCDLQDRPDQIPLLYQAALGGYDIVQARRRTRQDSRIKRLYSRSFYSVFSYLTGTRQDSSVANFGIYHRKVIAAVLSMNDQLRYFPAMVQWVGFRATRVDVQHDARQHGQSTYNLRRMLRLALDTMISFSDKPLRLVAQAGLILSLLSLLIGLACLLGYLLGVIKVAGYTSLMISIWLTAGLNIFVLGLVGIYVGKAFEKIKDRPIYILDEILNDG
jgi:dolichol-phosphate mannosyltransferase